MSDLKTNLELILNEKQTKIIPENIKSGITIFDIEGELETGVDTSDATALAEDIAGGKTAYVNGEKIEGTVINYEAGDIYEESWNQELIIEEYDTHSTIKFMGFPTDDNYILRPDCNLALTTRLDIFTDVIELTEDKIIEGQEVLGVKGAAKAAIDGVNCRISLDGLTTVNDLFKGIEVIYDLDLTNITTMFAGFSSSYPKLKTLTLKNTGHITGWNQCFSGCAALTDLCEIDASGALNVSNVFQGCTSLTNFGGFKDLGKSFLFTMENYSSYTLDVSACPLTHESLMNIINKLYDLNISYSTVNNGDLYRQKLILGTDNMAKLTEEEIAIATNKGWTVL